jgi:hypothetical protein
MALRAGERSTAAADRPRGGRAPRRPARVFTSGSSPPILGESTDSPPVVGFAPNANPRTGSARVP